MKSLSIIILLLQAAHQLLAQDSSGPKKKVILKISIDGRKLNSTTGYLANLTDTTVLISNRKMSFSDETVLSNSLRQVCFREIETITVRRKNSAGRGAWKGALTGLLLGALAGFIEGDDPRDSWVQYSAADKAEFYAASGAALGTGIGALIGALAKKKFIIGEIKKSLTE